MKVDSTINITQVRFLRCFQKFTILLQENCNALSMALDKNGLLNFGHIYNGKDSGVGNKYMLYLDNVQKILHVTEHVYKSVIKRRFYCFQTNFIN